MTNETEKTEEERSGLSENLAGVGQMIIGGLEQIGGILTGDPTTRAEGDFNQQVGSLHQEANKNLIAIERGEDAVRVEAGELNESERGE